MSKSEEKRLGVQTAKIPLSQDIGSVSDVSYYRQGITRGRLALWKHRAQKLEQDLSDCKELRTAAVHLTEQGLKIIKDLNTENGRLQAYHDLKQDCVRCSNCLDCIDREGGEG